MLEAYLRPYYQKYLVDASAYYLAKSLAPNTITYVGGLVGLLVLPCLIYGHPYIATLMLIISGYLDTLDGSVARLTANVSALGTVLDIVADRVVESAVVLGLFAIDPLHRAWLALGMLASILICVTSFLVVGIFTENITTKSFYYSPGLIERPEAFLFFFGMILVPTYFNLLAGLFIFLVLLTAGWRLYEFQQAQSKL